MGFGTGLNALITYLEAEKRGWSIDYIGVEAFPVLDEELSQLNYISKLGDKNAAGLFTKMHKVPWEISSRFSSFFSLRKEQKDFFNVNATALFDLIYFDAFGPRVQPELWTVELFRKMYLALRSNGILVTYSAKGSVRRNLQEVGFTVERLPGPPGKREMLRARKG